MTTLAIAPTKLTKEGNDIFNAALGRFDRVIIIDPHSIWCWMDRSTNRAIVYHKNKDISDIDSLVVRGSHKEGAALCLLSAALEINDCYVVDPPSRFSVGYSSKIKTTISRFMAGTGASSGFAFDRDGAHAMLSTLLKMKEYPIIIKPVDGKRSRGITVVKTSKRAKKIADEFFVSRQSEEHPFFIQKFLNVAAEYRVLVLDGTPLLCIRKEKSRPTAIGSNFVVAEDQQAIDVSNFAANNVNDRGVYGIDAGVTDTGAYVIFDANRAPQWRRLQEATGVGVGRKIVDKILEQINA